MVSVGGLCRARFLQARLFSSNIPGMTRKRREKVYERLVDLEKPYKKVMVLKDLLLKEPENVISLAELDRMKSPSRLTSKDRFRTIIVKYPSIFKLYKDEDDNMWCGFSAQAQLLVDREKELKKAYEAISVQKIRKLLMMSLNHCLRVSKIAQLRKDLGLPADFHSRMIYSYPQYFKVVEEKFQNQHGPLVALTSWDPSLAITKLEVQAKAAGEFNSEGEPLFMLCTSESLKLSQKQQQGMTKFQERPFISPYADSKDFRENTLEYEKRQVALLHEILSMTLEKRTVFDYLTHFRKEYRLPQNLLAMVLRHHSIFYVSRKGGRFVIFLKEAYDSGNLIEKNEWVLLKQQYIDLMDGKKNPSPQTNERMKKRSDNIVVGEALFSGDPDDPELNALVGLLNKIKAEKE